MTDAERIAAAVEQIKLATAGAEVNEKAARRLARRLSRWLRRLGVDRVRCRIGRFYTPTWLTSFWGFYCKTGMHSDPYNYPEPYMLGEIAEHVVQSVEDQAKDTAARGDSAYRARHKLEDVLRVLGDVE